ncbi:hypothetical protein FRC09_002067 [Ceratobasidium sp. 395]|nr:hypothetical protein FRC09_002067 [Ceratobasidium sp. 395]
MSDEANLNRIGETLIAVAANPSGQDTSENEGPATPIANKTTRHLSSPNTVLESQRAAKRQAVSQDVPNDEPLGQHILTGSSFGSQHLYSLVGQQPPASLAAQPLAASANVNNPMLPNDPTALQHNWGFDYDLNMAPSTSQGDLGSQDPFNFGFYTIPSGPVQHTQAGSEDLFSFGSSEPSVYGGVDTSSSNAASYSHASSSGALSIPPQPFVFGLPDLVCPYLSGLLQGDLLARLNITPGELVGELPESRFKRPWGNWERNFIILSLVGVGAPANRLDCVMSTYGVAKQGAILPLWNELNQQYFWGKRDPQTIIPVWWTMFNVFCTIMSWVPGPLTQPTIVFLQTVCQRFNANLTAATATCPVNPGHLAPFVEGGLASWFALLHKRLAGHPVVVKQVAKLRRSVLIDPSSHPGSTAAPSSSTRSGGPRSSNTRSGGARSSRSRSGKGRTTSRQSSTTNPHASVAGRAMSHSSAPQPGSISAPLLPISNAPVLSMPAPASPPLAADLALEPQVDFELDPEFDNNSETDDAAGKELAVPKNLPGVLEMVRNVEAVSKAAIKVANAKVLYLQSAAHEARAKAVKILFDIDKEQANTRVSTAIQVLLSDGLPDDIRELSRGVLTGVLTKPQPAIDANEVLRVLERYLPGPNLSLIKLVSEIEDPRVTRIVEGLANNISYIEREVLEDIGTSN